MFNAHELSSKCGGSDMRSDYSLPLIGSFRNTFKELLQIRFPRKQTEMETSVQEVRQLWKERGGGGPGQGVVGLQCSLHKGLPQLHVERWSCSGLESCHTRGVGAMSVCPV